MYSPTDIENFIALVKAMRESQKRYFHDRNLLTLNIAKNAERQVDARLIHLGQVRAMATTETQAQLFTTRNDPE